MYKKALLFTSKLPYDNNEESKCLNNGSEPKYQSIEYYIIENSNHVNDNKEIYRYGLCISKRNADGILEESLVESVSDSRAEVENLISSLCINTVTPLSLDDIMADLNTK